MKKMKIIKNVYKATVCILFLGVGLNACDFTEINEPKYQASKDDLKGDNFNLGAFFPQLQDIAYPAQENNFQHLENLLGDVYGRYMMTTKSDWNSKTFAVYKATAQWYGAPFRTAMPAVYTAWNEIKNLTDGEGVNFAWAQILRVAAMQRLTDVYGPIPYSKVISGNLTVDYDSQEEVYKAMFVDLDAAIAILTTYVTSNPGATPMADYDGVYAGDFSQWVKFANSLKLRMALRIRYADATLAQQMAEEAVNHLIGVMTTNSDNTKYNYSKGNPLKVMWDDYKDTRMCADLESYLKGYNDPRISKYFQQSNEIGNKKGYFGLRSGIATVSETWACQYSAPNVAKTDPLYWMMVSEITFCRAEGALLGWNMKGTAKSLYELGIKQSFELWGVSGYDAYIKDDTSVQADYEDPNGKGSIASISTITIQWNDGDLLETNLERLITQKWLALYPNGQEAWSEHRRTGYPRFFPVHQNTEYPALKVGNRIPFPDEERKNNASGYETGVRLLGGEDNYATKLWWDKKPDKND